MRRPLNTDDWRAAYRQWVYAQQLLGAVQQKVLAGRRGDRPAEKVQQDALTIGILEEQVQLAREAMDRCLKDILARRTPRAPDLAPLQEATVHDLVRMSIAVSEERPGQCRWELVALIADGSVITIDHGAETYPSRAAARAAARRALPPMPGGPDIG